MKAKIVDHRKRAVYATIPFVYPSWNKIQAMHWCRRKKHHDIFIREAGTILYALQAKPFTTPVKIMIDLNFKNKRTRDVDNYGGKWLIDAIRKVGLIPDDSSEWVPHGPDVMIVDGQRENKIILKIEEL